MSSWCGGGVARAVGTVVEDVHLSSARGLLRLTLNLHLRPSPLVSLRSKTVEESVKSGVSVLPTSSKVPWRRPQVMCQVSRVSIGNAHCVLRAAPAPRSSGLSSSSRVSFKSRVPLIYELTAEPAQSLKGKAPLPGRPDMSFPFQKAPTDRLRDGSRLCELTGTAHRFIRGLESHQNVAIVRFVGPDWTMRFTHQRHGRMQRALFRPK